MTTTNYEKITKLEIYLTAFSVVCITIFGGLVYLETQDKIAMNGVINSKKTSK